MTQRPTPVLAILLVAVLLSTVLPSLATAQTTTTTEYAGLQGQTRTTPYITYEAVRSSIRTPIGESGTEALHHTIIHVAKPDAEQNGQVPLLQNGQTKIVLFINEEDRTIERIQFFRVFV
jgi:hypothetical protein